MYSKKCVECQLDNYRENSKYCSDSCAYEVHKRKQRIRSKTRRALKPMRKVKCSHPDCTVVFETKHSRKKYCLDRCKVSHESIIKKKERAMKKEEKLREKEEDEKKRRNERIEKMKEDEKRKIKLKYSSNIKCSGTGCSNKVWKLGGYCSECQKNGKMPEKKYRTYRNNVSMV